MKRTSSIFKSMLMIALMCIPFALTSCEEEVINKVNTYSYGFISPNPPSEIGYTIQNTFKEELNSLGVNSIFATSFNLNGTTSECDKKVIAACKRAEEKLNEKLKAIAYEETINWRILRGTNDDTTEVYRYTIKNIESRNPTTVAFGYQNHETEDMLEYCNIVIEYTDGNETKVETITTMQWDKIITIQLPGTYTFKKSYTLKADKEMASLDSVKYVRNSHAYVYKYFDAKGDSFGYREVSSIKPQSGTNKTDKFAEKITEGFLDAINTFEFGKDGRLNVSAKEGIKK